MKSVPLTKLAEINPKGPRACDLSSDELCTFVPMTALGEDGKLTAVEKRPYSAVAKGYTAFMPNDILLAKITPCYENNKIGLAKVDSRFAFGSTEFHVIRCDPEKLDSRYLVHFLRQDRIRYLGERRMTGSGGQRRVPKAFLEQLEIPAPPLLEQRRIAAKLDMADGIRRKRKQALDLPDKLVRSVFLQKFGHPLDPRSTLQQSKLGIHCDFFAGSSLPKGEAYTGQAGGVFLIKVSDLNAPGNEVTIRSAKFWAPSRSAVKGGVLAPSGAVVFPKRGGAIATNKKRILERDSFLDPNLMAVAPRSNSYLSNQYLRTWFDLVDLASISSGSSVPQLNKKDLAPLAFGVPDEKAVESFDKLYAVGNNIKKRLRAALNEANDMLASLTQLAFRGQL